MQNLIIVLVESMECPERCLTVCYVCAIELRPSLVLQHFRFNQKILDSVKNKIFKLAIQYINFLYGFCIRRFQKLWHGIFLLFYNCLFLSLKLATIARNLAKLTLLLPENGFSTCTFSLQSNLSLSELPLSFLPIIPEVSWVTTLISLLIFFSN